MRFAESFVDADNQPVDVVVDCSVDGGRGWLQSCDADVADVAMVSASDQDRVLRRGADAVDGTAR